MAKNKKTHIEYINELRVKNPKVEALEQYINSTTKILHICKIHNIKWYISPNNVLHGRGCPQCGNDKRGNKLRKSQKEYIDELAIKNPTIKLVGEYINYKTQVKHYCEMHGVYWNVSPENALKGHGCPRCLGEKIGSALRKSEDQYVQELALINPTIKLVGKYAGANIPTEHYCEVHKIISNIIPSNALHGAGCNKCHWERMANQRRKNNDDYAKELNIKNPTVKIIGEYIGANIPVLHYCKVHQVYWNISPSAALQGQGCKQCCGERIGCALRKSKEQYVQELSLINPNIVLRGEYQDSNTPTLHECLIHNYVWSPLPSNILQGHGCPKCNESQGEKKITLWLENNLIANIPQKRFDDCRDKKELPFDFYIPKLKTCIEYQGEQHYRPVRFGGVNEEVAHSNFFKIQYHDKIKKDYCEKNNINLICIPYWEDVDEYLNKNLLI